MIATIGKHRKVCNSHTHTHTHTHTLFIQSMAGTLNRQLLLLLLPCRFCCCTYVPHPPSPPTATLTDTRCGADWADANGKCGAKCATNADCPGGEKCHGKLDEGVCFGKKTQSKIFDGECYSGKEIRMFEGNGDNPGTAEERTARCSNACLSRQKPLEGTWTGFVAKGFIVIPTSGRCYCESSDSETCKRTKDAYDRYDWKTPRGL